MSTGARTIPGRPSKKNPSPKRYRWACSRIISPTYIISVVISESTAGTYRAILFFFFKSNEPAKMPTITPSRIKKIDMRDAESGET